MAQRMVAKKVVNSIQTRPRSAPVFNVSLAAMARADNLITATEPFTRALVYAHGPILF
jgi:hypothetical protein